MGRRGDGVVGGGVPLTLTIRDRQVSVELAADARAALHAALLADPHSRLAMDVLAERRARCDEGVGIARSATPGEPAPVLAAAGAAWRSARQGCAELWTLALDAELAAVDARIADTRCGDRLDRVAASLADADRSTVETLAAELASLRVDCPAVARQQQIGKLEIQVAVVAKQLARAEAAERLRAARDEARAARRERAIEEQARAWREQTTPAMLRCNDGSLSPSCACGRASNRGCCSHHGGVAGCAR